jgi:Recombination endonuclease VII
MGTIDKSYNRNAMRKWRANPANHNKELARRRTPEARKKALANYLKRQHGITMQDYFEKLNQQEGHCAICDRGPDQEFWGRLNVDHDHTKTPGETGYFRGLLCTPHNVALGNLGDNEAGLLRALAYVRGE